MNQQPRTSTDTASIRRIVLIYAILASIWIALSDAALHHFFDDTRLLTLAQIYKGWAFVAVSALLLYILLRIELRRRQRIMALSDSKFESLVNQIEEYGIYLIDQKGKVLTWNVGAQKLYGLSASQAIGRNRAQLLKESTEESMARLKETQRRGWRERIITRATEGRAIKLEETTKPLANARPGSSGFLVVVRDVTSRMNAQDELEESRRRLSTLISTIPGVVYRCFNEVDWTMEFVSNGCEELTGYKAEELVGQKAFSFREMTIEEDRDRVWHEVQEAIAKGQPFEVSYRIQTKSGQEKWVLENGRMIRDPIRHLDLLEGIILDVSAEREAARELQRSEGLFRMITENVSDLLMLLDHEGRLTYRNPASETFFDGTDHTQLLDVVHSDDRELVRETMEETLREQENRQIECRFIDASKREVTVESQWIPLGLSESTGHGLLVVSRDITRRRALEQQLRQSQKMEAIGLMAGGIAHDFNNVLTAISGYASLLVQKLGQSNPLHNEARHIYLASRRASELTRQLLSFSRHQLPKPTKVDLNRIVGDSITVLARTLGETIRIHLHLDPGRPGLLGDPGQMQQVIYNLAINARDAMPEGGQLHVRTWREQATDDSKGVPPGDYTGLEVRDEGVGMDEERLQRIFDPFFTTKEIGSGTGIGLPTVYAIVQQCGGSIQVESELGQGTSFTLLFPWHEAPPEEAATGPGATSRDGSGVGPIVLVEDEPPLLELLETILQESGYTALATPDPHEALGLAERRLDEISMLISDVVLPKLSGMELAQRLWAKRPDLPILFISGYADEILQKKSGEWKGNRYAFLQKPFDPAELQATIRSLLH